ncbi:MAG: tRNA guanosine(34) transglycosylase Tgt [Caldilineales bacterium]|nr:tRNA guanosine(34) transglycosylase Tgt [Caldilineales bacterium]
MTFSYSLQATDDAARLGVFNTPHGEVHLPAFAPVGTQATVKTLSPEEVRELGAEMVLANTYHLYLRPGAERVNRFGGLHDFMHWDGPILTDSGGFQVFSLSAMRKVDDDGVTFRSHIDGSSHRFTPEMVMEVQAQLGADIIMCFDECPDPLDRLYNEQALARTHAWAERCANAQRRSSEQALFGIVQGGIFPDLRVQSAEFLAGLDLPGYAIGGLAVGETKQQMYSALDAVMPAMPADRPRYLMGVGAPDDIVEAVFRGVDLFDSVLPTRIARHGAILTRKGRINLRNARFADEEVPLEAGCACYACRHFTSAYVHHLLRANEIFGLRLTTLHNLRFLQRLMADLRAHIASATLAEFREQFLADYLGEDENV